MEGFSQFINDFQQKNSFKKFFEIYDQQSLDIKEREKKLRTFNAINNMPKSALKIHHLTFCNELETSSTTP